MQPGALTPVWRCPCLRPADPGYTAGDAQDGPDPLQVALASKESYQAIRALPAEAGSAVVFTHRCAGCQQAVRAVPGIVLPRHRPAEPGEPRPAAKLS